jgi:hypothetical protein
MRRHKKIEAESDMQMEVRCLLASADNLLRLFGIFREHDVRRGSAFEQDTLVVSTSTSAKG